MSDTAPLRRRLLRALDPTCLALLVATQASCVPTEAIEQQKRLEEAKKREQMAREAEAAARAELEAAQKAENAAREAAEKEAEAAKKAAEAKLAEELAKKLEEAKVAEPMPIGPFSCPSGEWCGTKAVAKGYAGNRIAEHPDALGCPGVLEPRSGGQIDPLADNEPPANMGYAYLDEAQTKLRRDAGESNLCCYDWGSYCGGGRPLLDEGRPKFAALERIAGPRTTSPIEARAAAGWLDDARMEHASIASFLRAEAELAALDAPMSLREACLRAADDERRHARDCFAIAAAHGEAWRPGELPHADLRRPSLEQLAVDTLLEGGIGETIAALMARRAARASTMPAIAEVLERIADDELEHAALAWQTIAWAIGAGGESVRRALQAAAGEARPDAFELPEADPDAEQLADHGRLDARAKAQAIRDAWRELIDPILAELAQRSRPSIATN
jgi:rubrerythrin